MKQSVKLIVGNWKMNGLSADLTGAVTEMLAALKAEFKTAEDAMRKRIRAGEIKSKDGGYPELGDLRNRFGERFTALADEQPADAVALDALFFARLDMAAEVPDLYRRLITHHLTSPKLAELIWRVRADGNEEFLLGATRG